MDWAAFFEAHDIPYVTSGPNTRRGQISIRCPWCAEDDPSEHLSVAPGKEVFGCWRSSDHAGRKAYSLVAVLLGCSFNQARLIVRQYSATDPDSFAAGVDLLDPYNAPQKAPEAALRALRLPSAFTAIKPTGTAGRFWRYLAGRGFDDVGRLVKRYELLCAQIGDYKDRVIIPVYHDDELVGWTGRAIQAVVSAPRYLSTEGPAIKKTVFNYDGLGRRKTLAITEGPFDALKLDFYGEKYGLRATSMFGVVPTLDQVALLRPILKRFDRAVILFDKNATNQAFQLADWLNAANLTIDEVPAKDPGALTKQQVLQLL